jgi:thiamine biosynthesis lipoprotein
MSADGYATAFMAMPLEESMTIIDSLLNIEVMIVYFDEQNEVKTYFTKNFKNLILD